MGATVCSCIQSLFGIISIHVPAWARLLVLSPFLSQFPFQSTRPRGARPAYVIYSTRSHTISIHTPAWGATYVHIGAHVALVISIHAPAWGATRNLRISVDFLNISIHAPAWGATYAPSVVQAALSISIHAPAWGATTLVPDGAGDRHPFNPRAPHGGAT